VTQPLDTDNPDEGSVRARVAIPGGGNVVMAGFPGLDSGIDGRAYIDPARMELTLHRISAMGAEVCLLLPEPGELPEGALQQGYDALVHAGIDAILLPIRDYAAPDAAFLGRWQVLRQRLHAMLNRGGTFAITCQYGAGRSGLVTALVLIERGMPADQAIAHVRRAFPEAVESDVQIAWLHARSPLGADRFPMRDAPS
tara:strand:+ start:45053 stop:45646 length:594 start_codon:yes stop_codon:yes gene_type:complete